MLIVKLNQSEKFDIPDQNELNSLNNQSGWYIEETPPLWSTQEHWKFSLAITGNK